MELFHLKKKDRYLIKNQPWPSGYDAWLPNVSSRRFPTNVGWPCRYISVRLFEGLSMVLQQMKDPLELFVKRREFLPVSGFQVSISSRFDLIGC